MVSIECAVSLMVSLMHTSFYLGLQFRTRNSQENGPSFTYASLPGVIHIPMDWKQCYNPDCDDISGEYITYHKLTDTVENFSAVVAKHAESNVIGLVVINTVNSTFLANDFVNVIDKSSAPPVYVVSLEDGEQLIAFIKAHDKGAVQIKVLVESLADSVSTPLSSPHLTPSS